jgi:hypothetical protein
MDVHNQSRERVFSILNDNDCPSFVIRQRRSPSPDRTKHERPSLFRQVQYKRTSSFSSDDSSPPLLRYDSSSSKSSSSSMDSSPSPITPAYNFGDPNLLPYDNGLRPEMGMYMPSSSGITPFMDSQLMIAPNAPEPYQKTMMQQPMTQYPILPAPTRADIAQLPTPAPSNNSAATSQTKTSPVNTTGAGLPPQKKNKYPCPYAQSHNCTATFTTSGHAARHGKKHTGEKGVHCPVCNKAFTRKDNMKQHERTHKGSTASSSDMGNPRRSKAAITKDATRTQMKKQDSDGNSSSDLNSSLASTMKTSPLSDVSLVPSLSDMSLPLNEPSFFSEVSNSTMIVPQPLDSVAPVNTIYPPLTNEALLSNNMALNIDNRLPPLPPSASLPMPPLIRGFSDLDTLAQAAESFDTSYQQTI